MHVPLWVGLVVVVVGALAVFLGVAGLRNEREHLRNWRRTTGRVVDSETDHDAGKSRLYVEYLDEEGVIVGFWHPYSVDSPLIHGAHVHVLVNPANRYRAEIYQPGSSVSSWWTVLVGAVIEVIGIVLVVLALI